MNAGSGNGAQTKFHCNKQEISNIVYAENYKLINDKITRNQRKMLDKLIIKQSFFY